MLPLRLYGRSTPELLLESHHSSLAHSALSRPRYSRVFMPAAGLCVLPFVLCAVMVLATLYGTVSVAPDVVLRILAYNLGFHFMGMHFSAIDQSLVWSIRLPRVVAAALVGGALGVAGTLFQGVLRNPLADPYVIGTSAGAQLGVALSLALPMQFVVLGFGPIQAAAFVGAVVTVAFVYWLARTSGRTPIVTLLLAGFVVSSFLISLTSFVMITTNRVNEVTLWTMGGIDISRYQQLAFTGPCVLVGVCLATIMAPRLDVILLGEEQATHLGVPVEKRQGGRAPPGLVAHRSGGGIGRCRGLRRPGGAARRAAGVWTLAPHAGAGRRDRWRSIRRAGGSYRAHGGSPYRNSPRHHDGGGGRALLLAPLAPFQANL